jgi:hypothetical protein
MVHIEKLVDTTARVVPLMAALPYHVEVEEESMDAVPQYIPALQRTVFAGRGYSTCRYDESAGGLFSSKTDTQKDDEPV